MIIFFLNIYKHTDSHVIVLCTLLHGSSAYIHNNNKLNKLGLIINISELSSIKNTSGGLKAQLAVSHDIHDSDGGRSICRFSTPPAILDAYSINRYLVDSQKTSKVT